jgi:predicted lysophospholipase L1 biosynthesis ABC-type transport system permease subunit
MQPLTSNREPAPDLPSDFGHRRYAMFKTIEPIYMLYIPLLLEHYGSGTKFCARDQPMAATAALLAITGFWVSIAADVRRRRGETALLAALGVTRREAAGQLCLEKLMLSLPAAVLGVLLGTVIARLLVPAVTLNPAAQLPTPPAITVDDLPLAIAFALVVTALPALTAALAVTRRPDPAAELRTADEA